jgi:hypothetical protein
MGLPVVTVASGGCQSWKARSAACRHAVLRTPRAGHQGYGRGCRSCSKVRGRSIAARPATPRLRPTVDDGGVSRRRAKFAPGDFGGANQTTGGTAIEDGHNTTSLANAFDNNSTFFAPTATSPRHISVIRSRACQIAEVTWRNRDGWPKHQQRSLSSTPTVRLVHGRRHGP